MSIAHPEQREGEVFIGNATREQFAGITLKTKRLGKQAYDVYDRPIGIGEDLLPVFVSKAEHEAD